MNPIYIELQIDNAKYVLKKCASEYLQNTNERGRVVTRVRPQNLELELVAPTDKAADTLLNWASMPYKPLPGQVVYYETKDGPALKTISWEDGQCVGYQESFNVGDDHIGAYTCAVTIAALNLEVKYGGPGAYQSPAPGEHGSPKTVPGAWPESGPPAPEPLAIPMFASVPASAPGRGLSPSRDSDSDDLEALPVPRPSTPEPDEPEPENLEALPPFPTPPTWLNKIGNALGSDASFKKSKNNLEGSLYAVKKQKDPLNQLLGSYFEGKGAGKLHSGRPQNTDVEQGNGNASNSASPSSVPGLMLSAKGEAGVGKVGLSTKPLERFGVSSFEVSSEGNFLHGKGEGDFLFGSDGKRQGVIAKVEGTGELVKGDIQPIFTKTFAGSTHDWKVDVRAKFSWALGQEGRKYGAWIYRDKGNRNPDDKTNNILKTGDFLHFGLTGSPGVVKDLLNTSLPYIPGGDLEVKITKLEKASPPSERTRPGTAGSSTANLTASGADIKLSPLPSAAKGKGRQRASQSEDPAGPSWAADNPEGNAIPDDFRADDLPTASPSAGPSSRNSEESARQSEDSTSAVVAIPSAPPAAAKGKGKQRAS